MKTTPWFKGTVKPVRKGVFERKYKHGAYKCYWDGKKWFTGFFVSDSKFIRTYISEFQELSWRGVRK